MGFFDTVLGMFGIGGAGLTLHLDAETTPQGGFVSGRVDVKGGKNVQMIDDLTVKLLYVNVESTPDSAIPNITTEIMVNSTIAQGRETVPGETASYEFSFQVPLDLKLTAHNVSYTILASADIKGAKDPSAKRDLKIVENRGMTANTIFRKWPALKGDAEQPLLDALSDMRWQHETDDEDKDMIAAEPILAKLMREGSGAVCAAALEPWSQILEGRVKPAHVRVLLAVDAREDLDGWDMRAVIEAASKFRHEGGFPILEKYATHEKDEYRYATCSGLDNYGGKHTAKDVTLLASMVDDESPRVRNAVIQALASYYTEPKTLDIAVARFEHETDPEALGAYTTLASRMMWTGKQERTEQAMDIVDALSRNSDEELRAQSTNGFGFSGDQPAEIQAKVAEICTRLMNDDSQRVRSYTATEIHNNMYKLDTMWDVTIALLDGTQTEQIRSELFNALSNSERFDDCKTLFLSTLNADHSEEVAKGILRGIRYQDNNPHRDEIKALLAQSIYPEVAKEAAEA